MNNKNLYIYSVALNKYPPIEEDFGRREYTFCPKESYEKIKDAFPDRWVFYFVESIHIRHIINAIRQLLLDGTCGSYTQNEIEQAYHDIQQLLGAVICQNTQTKPAASVETTEILSAALRADFAEDSTATPNCKDSSSPNSMSPIHPDTMD